MNIELTKEQAEEVRNWIVHAWTETLGKETVGLPPAVRQFYALLDSYPKSNPPQPKPEPLYLRERPFGTFPTPKLGWYQDVLCQWCESHSHPAQGWWVEVPELHP